jgi:hypothetical protein
MANDRVYLKCKTCGEARLLYEFWGGGDVGEPFPLGMTAGLEEPASAPGDFIQKHTRECRGAFGTSLEGESGFELFVESAAV